jgi:hypothetical protein
MRGGGSQRRRSRRIRSQGDGQSGSAAAACCGSGSWAGQRPNLGAYATGLVRQTSDHKEGVQAFKDKRPPKLTGR